MNAYCLRGVFVRDLVFTGNDRYYLLKSSQETHVFITIRILTRKQIIFLILNQNIIQNRDLSRGRQGRPR